MHPLDVVLVAVALGTVCFVVSTFWNPSSTFSWHQVLNTIAIGLLSVSAPIARARHTSKSSDTRFTLLLIHGVFNVAAVALILGAGVTAYLVKDSFGKPHLASWHSWIGVASGAHRNLKPSLVWVSWCMALRLPLVFPRAAVLLTLQTLGSVATALSKFPFHDDAHATFGLVNHAVASGAVRGRPNPGWSST